MKTNQNKLRSIMESHMMGILENIDELGMATDDFTISIELKSELYGFSAKSTSIGEI